MNFKEEVEDGVTAKWRLHSNNSSKASHFLFIYKFEKDADKVSHEYISKFNVLNSYFLAAVRRGMLDEERRDGDTH